ncbi:hypothetical protein [Nonomuraea typhae]|uniref:hypothetical protein n=1 Tax=Nonomuraea typhae TaxID=2603600 RepID=UPI0012F95CF2|nr:hypothetical protein [Nonomuraea typhae]
MSRLLARHTGRHVRRLDLLGRGSAFGWSGLAGVLPAVERLTRRRTKPLALLPVSSDLIPYRHPYEESR